MAGQKQGRIYVIIFAASDANKRIEFFIIVENPLANLGCNTFLTFHISREFVKIMLTAAEQSFDCKEITVLNRRYIAVDLFRSTESV